MEGVETFKGTPPSLGFVVNVMNPPSVVSVAELEGGRFFAFRQQPCKGHVINGTRIDSVQSFEGVSDLNSRSGRWTGGVRNNDRAALSPQMQAARVVRAVDAVELRARSEI
ncbi:MAG: hypothetical protein ACREHD_07015 [Pirellulales bacterium]